MKTKKLILVECNTMDCTIEKPDFVISENEKLDVTALQRHRLKVTRNYRVYSQEEAAGILLYEKIPAVFLFLCSFFFI